MKIAQILFQYRYGVYVIYITDEGDDDGVDWKFCMDNIESSAMRSKYKAGSITIVGSNGADPLDQNPDELSNLIYALSEQCALPMLLVSNYDIRDFADKMDLYTMDLLDRILCGDEKTCYIKEKDRDCTVWTRVNSQANA